MSYFTDTELKDGGALKESALFQYCFSQVPLLDGLTSCIPGLEQVSVACSVFIHSKKFPT